MKRTNGTITISAEVKEGPADCIRMAEVRAVLKKMKRHKAPGLSGLIAEMIQATGDIGTQWILDLCNGIVKEGSIPEDWKSSVVLPVYKGKGDPMECGSYRGIKLLEHAMKVVERIFEHRRVTLHGPSAIAELFVPFWYLLTWVVPEKGPLNMCTSSSAVVYHTFTN